MDGLMCLQRVSMLCFGQKCLFSSGIFFFRSICASHICHSPPPQYLRAFVNSAINLVTTYTTHGFEMPLVDTLVRKHFLILDLICIKLVIMDSSGCRSLARARARSLQINANIIWAEAYVPLISKTPQ